MHCSPLYRYRVIVQKPKGISECFQPSSAKSTTAPDVKRNKLKMRGLALYFPDRKGSRVAGRGDWGGSVEFLCQKCCNRCQWGRDRPVPARPCAPGSLAAWRGRVVLRAGTVPAFAQWEVSDCSCRSSWCPRGVGSSFPGKDGRRYPDTALSELRCRQCLGIKAALG